MLEIRLLGNFHVTYNGLAVEALQASPRLQTLLAYLLLHRDAPQPRQQIAFLFWPDSSEKQARTNLRKLLLQLRRALPDADRYLVDTQQTVQWRQDAPFWLDVAEVQRLLAQLAENRSHLTLLTQLCDLYTGELLPNCYEEWIVPLRQELHETTTTALAQLVHQLEAMHAYKEGIRYTQRLLHLDPLEEQTYLRLMRLRALDGDRTGALQVYHDCVITLRRELDVAPVAAIEALAKQLQAGVLPSEVTAHAPPQSGETPIVPQPRIRGVRLPTTPCFGRATALQRLSQRLATPDCRLLTLYGPGGIGKTRLALALAAAELPHFQHGAVFVGLAPLRTPETIAPAIANAMELLLVEGRRPETQLFAHLRNQQLLLILDNAEHLLDAADEESEETNASLDPIAITPGTPSLPLLIEQLLAAAANLKILVTSREPLVLYEEHTFAVEGLSLTPSANEPSTNEKEAPALADNEAVADRGLQEGDTAPHSAAERLFYHQLARVRPELQHNEIATGDRRAIAQICQLVEGMPLALELAATQLRTTSPTALIAGIQQTLDTLKVRWRGAHQRHQSMRAVIESSVMTLDETDQLLLARLAIFQGGFTLTGAQAVAEVSGATLDRLLHKSLLRCAIVPQPINRSTEQQAQLRFDLHTLIRQYAIELLAQLPQEMAAVARHYYQYHAAILHDGMTDWRGAERALAALAPLTAELDNLNAVGHWLLTQGTAQQRQHYFYDLWDLYRLERRLPEIIALLNDALATTARTAGSAEAPILAQWHRMLGEAYHILGEFEASRQHFEATLQALDFPLAGSGLDLLTTLQRQGLQQVLNRLGRQNLFRWTTAEHDKQPGLLDAIEAYRQLVDISLFSGDLIRLVNSALYALNLAERTTDQSALALTYSLMCLMTSAVPGAQLGKLYERLALERLAQVTAPERQIDIAIYMSAYYAGQGEWSRLDTLMQRAVAQSQALHAYRRWGYCQAIWASTFIYRGQFAAGLQAWRTLYEQSLASDSFLFILPAWAAGGMALCNVRLGAWQSAIDRAEQGLVHLQSKDDSIGRARCHAAIALARLMGQEYQSALNSAEVAMMQMRDIRPTNYAALECYAWVAEVYVALWQRIGERDDGDPRQTLSLRYSETNQPVTRKTLQANARQAVTALQSYAQVFPLGRPSAALAQGDFAWVAGRRADAYRSWQQSIDLATDIEMHYELGRAHHRLARFLPQGDPTHDSHRQQAEAIFTDLQTPHELASL